MRFDNVVSLFFTVISAVAAAEPSLKGADIPRALADGRPWSATMTDGETARMIFLADGSGEFDGPKRMPTTWRVGGDRLCVRMSLLPKSKCVTLRRSGTGFEAYEGAELIFRLSR